LGINKGDDSRSEIDNDCSLTASVSVLLGIGAVTTGVFDGDGLGVSVGISDVIGSWEDA